MKHFSNASMLDRAILAVAPMRGLERIQAKAKASVLMNYDAGGMGRRVKGLKAPGTDADASSQGARRIMRNRSRDLVRNAPYAKRAQMVVTNNVVGTGIKASITGKSKAAAKAASDVILPFLNSVELDAHRAMDFDTMQTVVCNSVFESGEVLALRRSLSAVEARGSGLPLAVEILEIDHLNSTLRTFEGNEVIDGMEYSESGVIVAYHLFERHPGAVTRFSKVKSRRVPASDVLHIRRIDRPGQMRGVPWLAPVMVTLAELRDYQEAQILKQKISALLAGVVTMGDEVNLPDGASGLESMSPGGFVYARPGEKVEFTSPPKVDDYGVVMRLGLWAIAMGIGITGEALSGDLSSVNFSSMRAGRLEMDKNIEAWQSQIMISQFCAGVGRWALEAYRAKPGRSLSPLSVSWTAQKRALVDPTKEVPAIIKKIEAGLSSLQREQRAMGLDPETVARERAEDASRAPAPATPEGVAVNETKKGVKS